MGLWAYAERPRLSLNRVCITCTPPNADPDVVVFNDHWKVVLHPDQTVPGACLIGALRHVPKLADLTSDEASAFFELYGHLELAVERAFGADLVNLWCLRNWAYRRSDPDPPLLAGRPNPHVHWHVAPRYGSPVEIAGERFVDGEFGEPLTWRGRRVSDDVRVELIDRIRAAMAIEFVALPT